MALPLPVPTPPAPDAQAPGPQRIRRCTYRRVAAVASPQRTLDVQCLYPDRRTALPLGDLEAAIPICNACTASHLFRPDED